MPIREMPYIDLDSEPFWTGCREGKLLYQYCGACDNTQFYPRSVCTTCWREDNLVWRESAGKGTIYSFTAIYVTFEPGWKGDVPYVVAIVELDEGYRVMSNIIGWTAESELAVGAPVTVEFDSSQEDLTVPLFRLAK